MGRSTTPRYRVEFTQENLAPGHVAWPDKYLGKPTTESLQKWVIDFEASMRPGGCNAHLGFHPVTKAIVIHQKTGNTVAEWYPPAFFTRS